MMFYSPINFIQHNLDCLFNYNSSFCTNVDIGVFSYEKVEKNSVMNIEKNLLFLKTAVADDRTSGPRFLAADASILTSETPSITPFCFSSKNLKGY